MSASGSKFQRAFGEYTTLIPDFAGFLQAVRTPAPLHVRVNILKTSPERVRAALTGAGWNVAPLPWCPWHFTLSEGDGAIGATLLHSLGHVYVQSASSALPALVLAVREGDKVLDLCAAPGSKATGMAEQLRDRGLLVANEPNRRRARSLVSNLERCGVSCAVVTTYSGQNFPLRQQFDRVLVDAPCSGEGTWRGPDARPQQVTRKFRAYLVRQQTALLRRGFDLLAPGGTLVYSTCTYSPHENECVVAELLATTEAEVLPLGLEVEGEPGVTVWDETALPESLQQARRLYPHRFNSEGFFLVRLAKP